MYAIRSYYGNGIFGGNRGRLAGLLGLDTGQGRRHRIVATGVFHLGAAGLVGRLHPAFPLQPLIFQALLLVGEALLGPLGLGLFLALGAQLGLGLAVILHQWNVAGADPRITSYNVCYTKLLR